MAIVGQQLLTPEAGWKRYNDNDSRIKYTGSFSSGSDSNCYNSTVHVSNVVGNSITFKFYGSKIRIINAVAADQCNNVSIKIDDITENYNQYRSTLQYQTLIYEKVGLTLGEHTLTLTSNSSGYFALDAIDIDSTGDLLGTGVQLLAPEIGWRRYDDTDSRIKYNGTWGIGTDNGASYRYASDSTSTLKIRFYGSKLRIIGIYNANRSANISIIIDGVTYTFSNNHALQYQTLVFEKLGLTLGAHTFEISNNSTGYIELDAIDIDSTGYLMHPILNQVSDTNSMVEGDCIPCRYTALTSGVAGYFSELGTCTATEIPITGTATPDGLFYLIKTAKGTLIADRVIQTNISWDVLNSAMFIEGIPSFAEEEIVFNQTATVGVMGTAISSALYAVGYEGWRVFNNDLSDMCMGSTNYGSMNGFLFNEAQMVTSLIVKTVQPESFKLQCSTDNITWFDVDCSYSGNLADGYIIKIKNPQFYKNYKIINTLATGFRNQHIQIRIFKASNYATEKISIRSLSGGCAYADASGNMSLTNKGLGAWPTNNEWDKYIVTSDLKGKITKGDNSIWHWGVASFCKETPVTGFIRTYNNAAVANTDRIVRNVLYDGTFKRDGITPWFHPSNLPESGTGFRPVLNYVESDIASEVIY